MKKKSRKISECILAIDVGTQSIKAALIDNMGTIHDSVRTEIEPYFSEKPGWAEQDPDYFWDQLKLTCRKIFRNKKVSKDAVKGVAVTTQRNTVINLGRNGNPLRPAIIWLDQRRAETERWPSLPVKLFQKVLGVNDFVKETIREADANWIRQNQPEIWGITHKYLFLSGFISYRLTGEFMDSAACQVGYVPFDYKHHRWADSSHYYWRMIPMDRDLLPDLVQPGSILGYVSSTASRETGIPGGLPVIATATDKACEVLGSGCLSPETACLSYGTSATIETTNSSYIEIIPHIPPFPGAVPGKYNTDVTVKRGYWMVNWFKKEFGLREIQLARKRKIEPEQLFDELVREIPPGSMGLTLQPYWSPGVTTAGPEAKGSIIGFGDVHTRAHLYRAILEGIAYALKEGKLRTEHKTKVKIEKLRVSGGGSRSNVAMQLTADIFNLPAERPDTFDTSLLGAAIDAAVGLNYYSDFSSAAGEMTYVGDRFDPVKESSDIYRELFEKVYLKMYRRLKILYDDIRDITGYPEA